MNLLKFTIFMLLVPLPIGSLALNWIRKTSSSISASVVFGLLIVTFESFIIGIVGLYPYAVQIICLQSLIILPIFIFKKNITPPKISFVGATFVLISVFINSQLLFPFGHITQKGISLYGAHFIDSTWHLALINSFTYSFPPENPAYSGTILTNYHYLTDLQISIIGRITGIDTPTLYFDLYGEMYLLLVSLLIYSMAYRLTQKQIGGISALSFFMLGSNYYYLSPLLYKSASVNPSVAWVDFYSTKVVNYPLLVSLGAILVFLEIVADQNKLTILKQIFVGIISGLLLGVKAHTAIVWTGAISFLTLAQIIFKKYALVILLISSVFASLLTLKYVSSSGSSLLQFNPFWLIKVMEESPDHLKNPDWELKRQTLLAAHSYLGVAKLYTSGLCIFFVLNFGLYLFGLLYLCTQKKNYSIRVLLAGMFITALVIPLLFIQIGDSWNLIQLIYVAFVPLSIGLAYMVSCRSKLFGIIIFVVFLASMLPGNAYITSMYQSSAEKINIGPEYVTLLKYLSQQKYGTVLAKRSFLEGNYLQAYSQKPFFLGERRELENIGLNYANRSLYLDEEFSCGNLPHNVKYILLTSRNTSLLSCATEIFFGKTIYLYQLNNL